MSEYICKITNVTKEFPGVKALRGVSFDVKKGEIHAIIGENGAGKSTLMNVLSGVNPQTSGTIEFDGKSVHFGTTSAAREAGVSMIHQELSLAQYMSVSENIFQGRMLKNSFGFVDSKRMYAASKKALERLGIGYIDPATPVKHLSVSQQQLVEIAKAISIDAKMLIMDEPTSALTAGEIKFLLEIMRSLRDEGVTVLFITHKLEEVLAVSDRITILRDGEYIKTLNPKETDLHEMISLMVGRNAEEIIKRDFMEDFEQKKVVLEVKNLSVPGHVKNVSFKLHEGEVLGLTGLVGAGRSELLEAIFGAEKILEGEIYVNGERVMFRHSTDAIKKGIGLVPEDRKGQGLFLKMPVRDNMTMVHAKTISGKLLMNMKKTNDIANEYVKKLSIRTPGIMQQVQNLSGGNQQKTIIARWMMHQPQILLMDEPTHGIDIGAKAEIYELIDEIAKTGVAVILLSSEMPEVITMSDRVMVMHHGELRGILNRDEVSQVRIMQFTLEEAALDA